MAADASARERLEQLANQDPETEADIQAYHIEAASIVRDYVEHSLDVKAAELSTEELLAVPTIDNGM